MTSRPHRHAPCQRDFLTSYSSATRDERLNLFSSRYECFTSDSGLTRTRLVSCVLLTSLTEGNSNLNPLATRLLLCSKKGGGGGGGKTSVPILRNFQVKFYWEIQTTFLISPSWLWLRYSEKREYPLLSTKDDIWQDVSTLCVIISWPIATETS